MWKASDHGDVVSGGVSAVSLGCVWGVSAGISGVSLGCVWDVSGVASGVSLRYLCGVSAVSLRCLWGVSLCFKCCIHILRFFLVFVYVVLILFFSVQMHRQRLTVGYR